MAFAASSARAAVVIRAAASSVLPVESGVSSVFTSALSSEFAAVSERNNDITDTE